MIDESMDREQMRQPMQEWEFRSKPAWQRLLIMIGGVLVNFVLALFIYSMIMFAWGENYIAMKDMTKGMQFNAAAKAIGFQDHDILLGTENGDFREFSVDVFRDLSQAREVRVLRDGKQVTLNLSGDLNLLDMLQSRPSFARPWADCIVDSVAEGTPAASMGLAKGDAIVAVDGKSIATFGEEKAKDIIIGTAVVLGIALSIVLFILIPTLLAGLTDSFIHSPVVRNLFEGLLRIVIFLLYLWGVAHMKDVERMFAYHGAEHKTIFCYEKGLPLTVENVRPQSRFHPRCGTSFLFVVVIISILVFSLVSLRVGLWDNPWVRIGLRLLLLPVVVSISYEINRWVGRHDNLCSRILSAPGKWLQRLTTNEPDDSDCGRHPRKGRQCGQADARADAGEDRRDPDRHGHERRDGGGGRHTQGKNRLRQRGEDRRHAGGCNTAHIFIADASYRQAGPDLSGLHQCYIRAGS